MVVVDANVKKVAQSCQIVSPIAKSILQSQPVVSHDVNLTSQLPDNLPLKIVDEYCQYV